jgi:hypothetical protein
MGQVSAHEMSQVPPQLKSQLLGVMHVRWPE